MGWGVVVVVEGVVVVAAKLAVMLVFPSTTKAQLPVPVQAPRQPVNVEPGVGVTLRARLVPAARLALQVLPHVMAAGLETTVPLPVPVLVTVTVWSVALAGVAQASLEYAESPALLYARTR